MVNNIQIDVYGPLKKGTEAEIWLWIGAQYIVSDRFKLSEKDTENILANSKCIEAISKKYVTYNLNKS